MLTPVKLWLLVMDLEVRRLTGRTDSDMVERVRDGLPVQGRRTQPSTSAIPPGFTHSVPFFFLYKMTPTVRAVHKNEQKLDDNAK